MSLRRKKRVRLHMLREGLPSVEGLLIARRGREYAIGVPQLLVNPEAAPAVLADARLLMVPREQVAFYEVLAS